MVPRTDVWGKWLDGRTFYPATQYSEIDYNVGAWADFKHAVITPMLYSSPIYFHPAFSQRASACDPNYREGESNPDIVAIPIPTVPSLNDDHEYNYRLWIDLRRPQFRIKDGVKFRDVERVGAYEFSMNKKDVLNPADTVFVLSGPKARPVLYYVDHIEDHDDKRHVHLDDSVEDATPLPDQLHVVGWILRGDTHVDTAIRIVEMLEDYRRLESIEPPRFIGVCGSRQPIVLPGLKYVHAPQCVFLNVLTLDVFFNAYPLTYTFYVLTLNVFTLSTQ